MNVIFNAFNQIDYERLNTQLQRIFIDPSIIYCWSRLIHSTSNKFGDGLIIVIDYSYVGFIEIDLRLRYILIWVDYIRLNVIFVLWHSFEHYFLLFITAISKSYWTSHINVCNMKCYLCILHNRVRNYKRFARKSHFMSKCLMMSSIIKDRDVKEMNAMTQSFLMNMTSYMNEFRIDS